METENFSSRAVYGGSQRPSRLNSINYDDLLEWQHSTHLIEKEVLAFDHQEASTAAAEYELHKYFMNVAILISQHRKKIKHQAGACIVNPSTNKIIGIGNYTHTDTLKNELLSWFKDKSKPKNDYLNHAEVNAISNKKESSLENCVMYVTSFPCIECAKMIAHSGINKVVFIEDSCCQTLSETETFAAKVLLELSGVALVKFQ